MTPLSAAAALVMLLIRALLLPESEVLFWESTVAKSKAFSLSVVTSGSVRTSGIVTRSPSAASSQSFFAASMSKLLPCADWVAAWVEASYSAFFGSVWTES